jgi:hypothetical protein
VRTCAKCKQDKPLGEFPKSGSRNGVQRYSTRCLGCRNQYYQDNIDIQWARMTLWKYQLTIDDVLEMDARQGGVCYFCKKRTMLYIDHDRRCCSTTPTCGQCHRGLLCHSCNSLLGWYERYVELVAEYVNRRGPDA